MVKQIRPAIITDYAAIAARMRELRDGGPGQNLRQATVVTPGWLAAVHDELHERLAQWRARPGIASAAYIRKNYASALVDIQLLRSGKKPQPSFSGVAGSRRRPFAPGGGTPW
jgi:hypothetical protein